MLIFIFLQSYIFIKLILRIPFFHPFPTPFLIRGPKKKGGHPHSPPFALFSLSSPALSPFTLPLQKKGAFQKPPPFPKKRASINSLPLCLSSRRFPFCPHKKCRLPTKKRAHHHPLPSFSLEEAPPKKGAHVAEPFRIRLHFIPFSK